MKISLIVFSISIIWSTVFSQQNITVTYRLYTGMLPANHSVYITGSKEQLGYWNPDTIKMERVTDSIWTKTILVNQPDIIEYKYTLGSWSVEGADSQGLPLSNFSVKVAQDTVIKDTVSRWTDPARNQRQSTITGTVKYHGNFKAAHLLPRDVMVWLPAGYETDTVKSYPVLYIQDGQNVFDEATSSFGHEWRVDETCDSLIAIGKIPPLIVVAVYNTSQRSLEYEPGKKGTAYMDFMIQTLKPFIDSTYRTMPSARYTLVAGSSSGGIFAFMLAWEHPDVFSKAICMSPALKIQDIDYVKVVKNSSNPAHVFFYIYNGGVGLEKKLQPGIDEMITILEEKGYQQGKDFEMVIDPKARHNEQAWARQMPHALQSCFDLLK